MWVEDYGADALKAAVAAGKTTLSYYGGTSLAVANHREVARYVAERVAEELTNALVLPIIPDGPEAYGAVNRAITGGGFKNVIWTRFASVPPAMSGDSRTCYLVLPPAASSL